MSTKISCSHLTYEQIRDPERDRVSKCADELVPYMNVNQRVRTIITWPDGQQWVCEPDMSPDGYHSKDLKYWFHPLEIYPEVREAVNKHYGYDK